MTVLVCQETREDLFLILNGCGMCPVYVGQLVQLGEIEELDEPLDGDPKREATTWQEYLDRPCRTHKVDCRNTWIVRRVHWLDGTPHCGRWTAEIEFVDGWL